MIYNCVRRSIPVLICRPAALTSWFLHRGKFSVVTIEPALEQLTTFICSPSLGRSLTFLKWKSTSLSLRSIYCISNTKDLCSDQFSCAGEIPLVFPVLFADISYFSGAFIANSARVVDRVLLYFYPGRPACFRQNSTTTFTPFQRNKFKFSNDL